MKRNILLLIVITTFFCSCKKFLEEQSKTEIIPKRTSDFGDLLAGQGYLSTDNYMFIETMLLSDDIQYFSSTTYPPTPTALADYPVFQWQADFITLCQQSGSLSIDRFNTWKTAYKCILGSNIALQYLDGSIGSQSEKDWYKGQAYALRAFNHFILVNTYGNPYNDSTTTPDKSLGVPIRLDANVTEKPMARNTVKEVYNQITQDLDSAITLLERERRNFSPRIIDRSSAHLLASRVYLYMEDWTKVVENASKVIEVHPDILDLNSNTNSIISTSNIECLFWYGDSKNYFDNINRVVSLSDDLNRSFEDDDLRVAGFYCDRTPDFLKFLFPSDLMDNKWQVDNSNGLTWRTSEAYLNRAEANIQLYRITGDVSKAQAALDDLNKLRVNRYLTGTYKPWTLVSGDKLLQQCRDERRREFTMEEGHRWFDLRRYGMPEIKHIYTPAPGENQIFTLKKHDPQYTLPIPPDALQRNPGLVQNKQITTLRKPD
ncbi:RagB/SusD family nutrient uptake outer membrane protein [Chitinophaga silvatica]|uniref:RagB/SusD family nutrient uptake outer membrane protein n=1 Tax=Chitinophaga silvatica TaxID=2282649 RepID=A0A3E1Y299_9BACT|nr:RagB/SusD family nutrient uptake outer membrane protein [Chitinophaga silvatica]RFS18802.1 RagB/SusD family nutrient uptake outer membrane protein [Chitinophaga silvatica]